MISFTTWVFRVPLFILIVLSVNVKMLCKYSLSMTFGTLADFDSGVHSVQPSLPSWSLLVFLREVLTSRMSCTSLTLIFPVPCTVASMNTSIALVCYPIFSVITLSNLFIGRTARIGNVGLATSFYNDKDEELADALVRTLLETKQPVPDFLESRIPEDGKLEFDDDTDNEGEDDGDEEDGPKPKENGGDGGDGGAWGAPAKAKADADGATWGTNEPAGSAWPAEKTVDAAGGTGEEWVESGATGSKKKQKW
jgi:hypothetical protein